MREIKRSDAETILEQTVGFVLQFLEAVMAEPESAEGHQGLEGSGWDVGQVGIFVSWLVTKVVFTSLQISIGMATSAIGQYP